MAAKYFPLAGVGVNIVGAYGPRPTPQNPNGFHYGLDLGAPVGTPIVAVDDGTLRMGTDALGGNVIVLHGKDGRAWYFAHLDHFASVAQGAAVTAGQLVGFVGMTGNAARVGIPHVHVESWPSGAFQRPAPDPTRELLAGARLSAPLSGGGGGTPWWAFVAGAFIVAGSIAVAVATPRRRM